MSLSPAYQWLEKEPGPRMIKEAVALCGTVEIMGKPSNPTIMSWAAEVGGNVKQVFIADEIPWCGLFMAVVAKRAGKALPKDPLWALNWGTFGEHTATPLLGDVLVFVRRTSDGRKAGHVGLYVGEDETAYHVMGGNQSDCVCVTRLVKSRLYAARRPHYKAMPANVRKIRLKATGKVSVNEQ